MIIVGSWQLDISDPLILVSAVILVISLFFTLHASWLRLAGRNKALAVLVLILNSVAYICVLLLLTQPQREDFAKENILLVTEGADVKSDLSFKDRKIYVAPSAEHTGNDGRILRHANWLLDIGQLNLREPALAAIDVLGYGLHKDQWQSLSNDIQVNFKPHRPAGFTGMQWTRNLVSGETLIVKGRYWQPDLESVIQLRLLDPAGKIAAETRIRNGDTFTLMVRPRGPGNLAYPLQALRGETLLGEQMVYVSVASGTAPDIMVEQSAPSYETRQLKNFASAIGARVQINTQISKGKSISQSANLPGDDETGFSPATLAARDVLIMDGRALGKLSVMQTRWLTDAIADGLGLLLLADNSLVQGFEKFQDGLLEGFELKTDSGARDEAVVQFQRTTASVNDFPIKVNAMSLQATGLGMDVLFTDEQKRVLLASRRKDLGRVAISLINQSHGWLTSGRRDLWSDYWSAILSTISRQRQDSFLIPHAQAEFYSSGERTPVCAFATGDKLTVSVAALNPSGTQAAIEVPLTADSLGSDHHCGWFWPVDSGWYRIQFRSAVDNSLLDQLAIHILESGQWQSQKRHQRLLATLDRVAGNRAPDASPKTGKKISAPLNSFWLWLLLVISASLLWLERKLDFDV